MTTSSLNSDSMSSGPVFQNCVYIGINIQNILYGILLLIYFKTIRILVINGGTCKKSNTAYAWFSTILVFLATVWVATQAMFGEKMWLLDSQFPGGPDEYWKMNISTWYMDWGTTAVVILQLMTDALMIYRCRIIWNNYRVVIIPGILWLVTLALGFLIDWTTSSPGGNFFSGISPQIGFAYYTVAVFMNATLTCLICYRIVRHGMAVRECLGREHASLYFSIVTIVVESVLPYTLSGIAFLISLGLGSATSVAFMCVYMLMMCISPQMLILRVIAGTAFDEDTFGSSSSPVKFSAGRTSRSLGLVTSAPGVHLQTLSRAYLPDGHDKV